ncbi:MAG: TolC family protein [Gemmatimonadales bacterium]|nr:MAG: TolC family protein [Gemmatimonadales bacterium]
MLRQSWRVLLLLLLVPGGDSALHGQTLPQRLSLPEAMELARRNNPGFLASQNDIAVADWDVRSAYGAWAPSASLSGSMAWQGQGEQVLAGALTASQFGVTGQPDYYSSSYRAGVNWSMNGQTLFAPSQAKASRDATAAQINRAQIDLESQVTRLYLDVLRQDEAVSLAGQQLDRANFNLRLAQAQAEVGTATLLDVRQAEVQVGRAEVALLQSENARVTARLRLLQQIGVDPTQEVELSTTFALEEPGFREDDLFREALDANPSLRATRESAEAASVGEKIARSAYFPTLSLSAGISGFAREASDPSFLIAQAQAGVARQIASCAATNELYSRLADPLPLLDCSQYAFTDDQRRSIIESNDAFPFDFTRSPPSASLSVSIPVFQGLSRQRNLEAARVQSQDLRLQLRQQELALRADLSANLAQVRTAYASALIEERNQALADEQLRLARERYQVGAIPFVDLVEAETVKAQADRDRVAAVYAYHDAVTNLEAAIGRPLRIR